MRDLYVSILREIAELYPIDGLQLDFARMPVLFAPGEQWLMRDHLTDFVRRIRHVLLEIAAKRGRPCLLAVRAPENVIGCHFDGFEIERWIDEQLFDLLVPGAGGACLDIPAYRRLIGDRPIPIYASWDPIHPTDAYREPPIEYWRGLYSKWWAQGADGVQVFNVDHRSPLLPELADPKAMQHHDKVFIVERRSGSHGELITGDPDNWQTPRHMFFMTYMLAPLPAILDPTGKADTLLTLEMTDDVHAGRRLLSRLSLRVLISDPTADDLAEDQRVEPAKLWTYEPLTKTNQPPALGIEQRVEARINNIPLGPAAMSGGWLELPVTADQLAVGDNLIGLRHACHPDGRTEQILIEKVELHVKYKFVKMVYMQDE